MATAVTTPAPAASFAYRSPLALWHLLSLDAPGVAAVWTLFLARCFGMRLTPGVPLALALAVWAMYVADRMADAHRGGPLEERHRFHARHRQIFLGAMVCVLPVLAVLVFRLPVELRRAWGLLSLPLAIYIAMVHGWNLPRIPKEAAVGVFFGTATALPVSTLGRAPVHAVIAGVLFGTLCWLNGLAISRWEYSPVVSGSSKAWFSQRAWIVVAVLALSATAACAMPPYRPFAIAILLSIYMLCLIDRERFRFDRVHVRALADLALLTPLLVWPLLPWLTTP